MKERLKVLFVARKRRKKEVQTLFALFVPQEIDCVNIWVTKIVNGNPKNNQKKVQIWQLQFKHIAHAGTYWFISSLDPQKNHIVFYSKRIKSLRFGYLILGSVP